MVLSIIIASWNVRDLLAACLASLRAVTLEIEIIVVDNASTDGSAEMVAAEFPQATLIRNATNIGFARANNQGICLARGRYVLLLNADTVVPPGALAALVDFMDAHPQAGACGPRLLHPDGTPQPYAFGRDPTPVYLLWRGLNRLLFHRYVHDWATDQVQEAEWVSGACLIVRREAIEQIGGLDENIFMYFEDNDWCLRLRRAGWRVYYNPQASITHLGGQSVKQNSQARTAYYRSLEYFYAKHYGLLARSLLKIGLVFYRALSSIAQNRVDFKARSCYHRAV
jgi:GT2 family glycosyltransferase